MALGQYNRNVWKQRLAGVAVTAASLGAQSRVNDWIRQKVSDKLSRARFVSGNTVSRFEDRLGPGNPRSGSTVSMRRTARRLPFTSKRQRTIQKVPGYYSGYLGGTGPKRRDKDDNYELRGCKVVQESAGSIRTQHVNYLGFNAISPLPYYKSIGVAVLRHVMKLKYNVDYTSVNDTIWTSNTGIIATAKSIPRTFAFGYFSVNDGNGLTTPGFLNIDTFDALANSRTVGAFGDAFAIAVHELSFGNSRYFKFDRLNIVEGTGVDTVHAGTYDLNRLYMKAYGICRFVIQNSTASEAGSLSTDVVDSNPIAGKVYYYIGSGGPRLNDRYLKTTNAAVSGYWESWYNNMQNGVWYPGTLAGGVSVPNDFQNIPDPSFFQGIKSYRNVVLQPGQSTVYSIKKNVRGSFDTLVNFLTHRRTGITANINSAWSYMSKNDRNVGCFLALEKMLKLDRFVKLHYHADSYHGAVVTGYSRPAMRGAFTAYSMGDVGAPVQALTAPVDDGGVTLARSFAVADLSAFETDLDAARAAATEPVVTDSVAVDLRRSLKKPRRRVQIVEDAQQDQAS